MGLISKGRMPADAGDLVDRVVVEDHLLDVERGVLCIAHAEGEKRRRLERARDERWTIEFFEYDWNLNAKR